MARRTPAVLATIITAGCGSSTVTQKPGGEVGGGGADTTGSSSSTISGGFGAGGDGGSGAAPPCDAPAASEVLHPIERDAYGAVVATSTEVFWIEIGASPALEPNGVIYRTHKCGGGARIVVANTLRFPAGLAHHGDDVFWTELGTNTTGSLESGKVRSETTTLALDDCGPSGVAADASHVFWSSECGVFRIALGGGTSADLGQYSNADVTVDDERAYWITGDGGIDSAPKNGGPVTTIAPGVTGGCTASPDTGLVADGDELFWVTCGSVRSVNKDGTGLTNLAGQNGWPLHGATGVIAVDEHWVYMSQNYGARAEANPRGTIVRNRVSLRA